MARMLRAVARSVLVRWLRSAAVLLTGLACSCGYTPPPAFPRPALQLPTEIAARYAVDGEPRLLASRPVDDDHTTGELLAGPDHVRFHLWRSADPGRPLVLLVPILAGGEDLMSGLARRLLARGFDVAWCDRVAPALRPPQRGPDLEALFVATVRHQRLLLSHLHHTLAPPAVFVLGVSLGGMVATVLAALEPAIDAVAICLSGGDVGRLVLVSGESRVQHWVRWRHEVDGIGDDGLRWELANYVRSDPIHFAAYVATDKVAFVSASLDEVAPRRHQDLLWEGLGRPQRFTVPLGHYSAVLALEWILDAVAGTFTARLPRDSGDRAPTGQR